MMPDNPVIPAPRPRPKPLKPSERPTITCRVCSNIYHASRVRCPACACPIPASRHWKDHPLARAIRQHAHNAGGFIVFHMRRIL